MVQQIALSGEPVDILLIEDNPSDAELSMLALHKSAPAKKVHCARNGTEALEFLFGERGHAGKYQHLLPSLVLLDLDMPDLDGFQVLRSIRSHRKTKHLPVVVFSSSDETDDILKSYHLGANSYITKPVNFQRFSEVIGTICSYWFECANTLVNILVALTLPGFISALCD